MATKYDEKTTAATLVADYASHIAGKTVLTTGVSPGGIGAYFVEAIAKAQPKLLILAGRDTAKVTATAAVIAKAAPDVATRTLKLDLASLKKTREAAAKVNAWTDVPHIDVLVNNAAIMACDWGRTEDGFERQFATNHLGPFLFTNLILDKVLAAPEPRIVNVSSDGHRLSAIRWWDFDFHDGENYSPWTAYGQSKTANMLFALSLAERYADQGLTAVSLHPGVVTSNLGNAVNWETELKSLNDIDKLHGDKRGWSKVSYKGPDTGCATHVYAAFEPVLKEYKAAYCLDSRIADPEIDTVKQWATDLIDARRLWNKSEELVGQKF